MSATVAPFTAEQIVETFVDMAHSYQPVAENGTLIAIRAWFNDDTLKRINAGDHGHHYTGVSIAVNPRGYLELLPMVLRWTPEGDKERLLLDARTGDFLTDGYLTLDTLRDYMSEI